MTQDEAVELVRANLGKGLARLFEDRGALDTGEYAYIVYSVGGWLVAVSTKWHVNDYSKWDVRPARTTLKNPPYELIP